MAMLLCRPDDGSAISSLFRFFPPFLLLRLSTGAFSPLFFSFAPAFSTLTVIAAFSCSSADSTLVRLVGEFGADTFTFSAEPVRRRTSTGRAGTAPVAVAAEGKVREVVSDVVVLRSFKVGVGDPSLPCATACPGVVVALTGLAHSGPRNPPPVLIGATFPRIVLRMLVSILGLATGDDRTGAIVRGGIGEHGIGGNVAAGDGADEVPDTLAVDVLATDALLPDVLATIVLAELFEDGATRALDFPFPPVSMINGTNTFEGGGLMFS